MNNRTLWGAASILLNVVLILINLWVVGASGSLAVRAELVHNITDFLTAIAVLVSIVVADQQSNKFPYGLHKAENFVSLGIAVATLFTGYEIVRRAAMGGAVVITATPLSLILLGVAFVLPLVFSIFEMRAGRRENSPVLIADATEYRAHMFTTGLVILSIVLNISALDKVVAVLIALVVGQTGARLAWDNIAVLLDAAIDAPDLDTLMGAALSVPSVEEVERLTAHAAGGYLFVEAVVRVRDNTLDDADYVVGQIQARMRSAFPNIERAIIRAKPASGPEARVAVALNNDATVSAEFGAAPQFMLCVCKDDSMACELHDNPYADQERRKGLDVAKWLIDKNIDVIIVGATLRDRSPHYVMDDARVREVVVDAGATVSAEFLRERCG